MLSKAVKHLAITGVVILSLVLAVQAVLADKPGSAERVAESLRKALVRACRDSWGRGSQAGDICVPVAQPGLCL